MYAASIVFAYQTVTLLLLEKEKKKTGASFFCKLIIYSDSCLHFLFVLRSET